MGKASGVAVLLVFGAVAGGLWFGGGVEADCAEGQGGCGDFGEGGLLHEAGQIAGVMEGLDSRVEVAVGGLVAGDEAADEGDDVSQIYEVSTSEDPVPRQRELQYQGRTARLQKPVHFDECLGNIGHIPDAEGHSHNIEAIVAQVSVGCIGLHESDTVAELAPCYSITTDRQHILRYVQADGFGDIGASAKH